MTISDSKKFYTRFLKGHEGKLHFAAHSHHFWPDVTRDAQLEYWDDTAKTSDHKWDKIYSTVIPNFQNHVANILGLKDKKQIVFAPNTHEFGARILSLFLGKPSLKILTTSNEFHSWRRQLDRLKELPPVQVETVSVAEKDFVQSLKKSLQSKPDIFFISQVFFDSGIALTDETLLELCEAKSPETIMVVDGYHGFCAVPGNLSKLEGKIFYMAGGYKYAQAGEGAAFLVVPKGDWRPAYTGWFAEYAHLSSPPTGGVGYSQDGMAFMGATQDPSGLYRFNAVWDQFARNNMTVETIHSYVKDLQKQFLNVLPQDFTQNLGLTPLFHPELSYHGHFLTFEALSEDRASLIEKAFKTADILIDRRGKRLRFGFGLYQDLNDVQNLCARLEKVAKSFDKI